MNASQLTEEIKKANEQRLTDEAIDLNSELEKVLESIGLSQSDSGGKVEFDGKDPIVPSVFRLASAAGISMAAKSVAIAKLWKLRGGRSQDIKMDIRKVLRRLSPFYEKRWELLNGFPPGTPSNPDSPFSFQFYETKDGKWVMPLNPYPRIKSAAMRFLGCSDDPKAVADAIKQWDSAELEKAAAKEGIVMPVIRSVEEFMEEPAFKELAKLPLIEIEKIGDSDPEPLSSDVSQPLEGIRALGLGRVIAGAGIGRALANHGADALNIWRPHDWEHDMLYYTANVGVRSAMLDLNAEEGKEKMHELLKGADIFYTNRRKGLLERLGLTAEDAAKIRPGIIHCSISLHGQKGPWADRPGFDQTAGSVSGVMAAEGKDGRPKLPPIMVVNDHLMTWLAAAGIIAAMERRAKEGGSYRVHLSLTRVSMWLLTLGMFDQEYAHKTAGSSEQHEYRTPDLFTAETTAGHYQGVTDQVEMSETPGGYKTVMVPRASGRPEWNE